MGGGIWGISKNKKTDPCTGGNLGGFQFLPSNVNTSYFAITIVLGGGIDDIDDKLAEVLDDDVDEIQDDILDAVEVTCTVQYRVTRHSTVQLYYTHTSSTD